MPKRRKPGVIVQAKNVRKSQVSVAGGSIGEGVSGGVAGSGKTQPVDASFEQIEDATFKVAGADIVSSTAVAFMAELEKTLAPHLGQQSQVADLHDIVGDLQTQAEKPAEERNPNKVRRLLENLGAYIGLGTLALSQAENAQKLFDSVKRFFGIP